MGRTPDEIKATLKDVAAKVGEAGSPLIDLFEDIDEISTQMAGATAELDKLQNHNKELQDYNYKLLQRAYNSSEIGVGNPNSSNDFDEESFINALTQGVKNG